MLKRKRRLPKYKQPRVSGVFSDRFGLPMEVLLGLPELVLRGNREVVLEHCRSLLCYTDEEISIRCKKLVITMTGENLVLTAMTESNMRVSGTIREICFSEGGDPRC